MTANNDEYKLIARKWLLTMTRNWTPSHRRQLSELSKSISSKAPLWYTERWSTLKNNQDWGNHTLVTCLKHMIQLQKV